MSDNRLDRLVTVYLPTKNRYKSLVNAVNSVLTQNYSNIQLVVISDGSTDETNYYLTRLSESDSRVKVLINEKSLGAPASRNLAIQMATGEFVTGLDDDDLFLQNRISDFVKYWDVLEERGERFSALYSQSEYISGGVSVFKTNRPDVVSFEDLFRSNSIGNQIFTKRCYLLDIGGFDQLLPAWQDIDLFFRLLNKRGRARRVNNFSYRFDCSPRKDRISESGLHKLKSAMLAVSNKASVTTKHKEYLYLQLFWGNSILPRKEDFFCYIKNGYSFFGLLKLSLVYFKVVFGKKLR
jgi:glycosyltransferase involved in cell wall biosynthesis